MLSKDERPAVLRELEPNRKSADPLPLPDDEKSGSPETFDLRGAVDLLAGAVLRGAVAAVLREAARERTFRVDFAARLIAGAALDFGRAAWRVDLISALTLATSSFSFAAVSLFAFFCCSFSNLALSLLIRF